MIEGCGSFGQFQTARANELKLRTARAGAWSAGVTATGSSWPLALTFPTRLVSRIVLDSRMQRSSNALLALEDGRVFRGRSWAADGESCGEMVFNTSMSGYQEVLTDPSYAGQIVCMTYP